MAEHRLEAEKQTRVLGSVRSDFPEVLQHDKNNSSSEDS